ncbi:MAG: monovalent cation/H(+) antiporter subunit G [Kiloniellales bacterium]
MSTVAVILDILSWACLLGGAAFSIIGGIGLLRLPDLFTRMHGAGLIDTLGAGLILIGLMLQGGASLVTAKLILILLFIFFTVPTATHALAKAALHSGVKPLVEHDGGERKEGGPSTN